MLGDGTINLRFSFASVDAAGDRGPVEVEIFNPDVWALEPTQTLRLIAERYLEHVA